MSDLDGLRVVVVGGASGIGRATVERAAALGAHVGVLDRDDLEPPGAVEEVVARRCDATDVDALGPAMAEVIDELGGIDALMHTAGVHDGFRTLADHDLGSLAATCEELWRVNVTSALLAVRAALPELGRSEHASVTLTSSESGFGARGGGAAYTASKWALRGLVDHLAAELAPEIRVNGVAPGGTSGTRLRGPGTEPAEIGTRPGRAADLLATTKLHRRIEASDVATAYTYLASPNLARAITGVTINVDGGRNTI